MENFTLQINGVINMPNLDPREKLLMIQYFTMKSLGINQVFSPQASQQIGWSINGWRKVNHRLMDKGYIRPGRGRGMYQIVELNIF